MLQAQPDAAAVEDCIKRVQAAKGVSGVIVINADGMFTHFECLVSIWCTFLTISAIIFHNDEHKKNVATNVAGTTSKSTMDNSSTIQYSTQIQQLTTKAIGVVRDLEPENELTFYVLDQRKMKLWSPHVRITFDLYKSDRFCQFGTIQHRLDQNLAVFMYECNIFSENGNYVLVLQNPKEAT